jgi:adenylosuccinate synthase
MAARIILGAQWGDEGKGKIVDLLSDEADYVVRYQGGSNAGHTIVVGAETWILHLVPSGILHPDKICVLGNGVVIDPTAFLQEIDALKKRGVDVEGRIKVSERAHLIFPYHKTVEAFEEDRGGGEQGFGTTRRGIGPAYRDKAGRTGIRVVDLFDEAALSEKVRANVDRVRHWVTMDGGGRPDLDPDQLTGQLLSFSERLKPMVTDTSLLLYRALKNGRSVLLEGAQGSLLDVDQGTYPYVTSSNATAGGALTGAGIGPHWIEDVIGVAKAYTTRVGRGPFPSLAITKIDVLSGLKSVKIATGYQRGGEWITELPAALTEGGCVPVYEEHPGWQEDLSGCRRWEDLPEAARAYLDRIREITDTPIGWVSVGSARDQTIILQ